MTDLSGSLMKRLLVRQPKPKENYATVAGQPAALLPWITALLSPTCTELPLGEVTVKAQGKTVSASAVPLGGLGDHDLVLTGADGSIGWAKVVVKLKHPKSKITHLVP